jgi:alpha-galactosidase
LNMNSFIVDGVDFWGHNDADMLEVGNAGLTAAINILLNKYLLAFNQDSVFGAPAKPYKWGTNPDWTFNATNPAEFWSGQSQAGALVLLLNTLGASRNMTADLSEIPGLDPTEKYDIRDVWTGEELGCCTTDGFTVTVGTHDTAALLFTKA